MHSSCVHTHIDRTQSNKKNKHESNSNAIQMVARMAQLSMINLQSGVAYRTSSSVSIVVLTICMSKPITGCDLTAWKLNT